MDAAQDENSFIVKIKKLDGSLNTLEVSKNMTIHALKEKIKDYTDIPIQQQRLLFNRRTLENDLKIKDYNINDQDTIFLTLTTPNTSSASSSNNNSARTQSNPNTFFPSPFGGNIPEGVLNSVMQNVMDSPELIRMVIDSNPFLNEVRERNPELSHILDDPQLLRQSMEMMRNPSLMREMTRTADRAMSNIEAVPGGFNALRRMYQNFQEPMWNAALQRRPNSGEPASSADSNSTYNLRTEQPPNSEALPNPWDNTPALPTDQVYSNLRNSINMSNPTFRPDMMSQLASMFNPQNTTETSSQLQGMGTHFPIHSTQQMPMETPNNYSQSQNDSQSTLNSSDVRNNRPSGPTHPLISINQNTPEVLYSTQLTALRNMGFTDTQRCIQALEQTGGNLNRAIDRLLDD